MRARRRRGEHGRLARVAQPRRAVAAADRLPRRQQQVRHGHGGRARVGRARAAQARERLPHARRGGRRRRPRGGDRGDARGCSTAPARSASRPCWRRSPTATAATRSPTPGSPTGPRRRSRSTRSTTRCCAPPRGCARPARATEDLRAIDERVEERVQAAVEFAAESPEPDVDALAWAMHARAPTSSSPACGRAARSARRSSSSTGGWASERRDRAAAAPDQQATGTRADDLPRGAAARAARGAARATSASSSWARRSASSRAPTRSPPA